MPADASRYERIGALLARAIGTDDDGGAAVDDTATSILAGLSTAEPDVRRGQLDRPRQPGAGRDRPGQGAAGSAGRGHDRHAPWSGPSTRDTDGRGARRPGRRRARDGLITAVRDDAAPAATSPPSTRWTAPPARWSTVMALAGRPPAGPGQYGAVDAADGAMPGAAPG